MWCTQSFAKDDTIGRVGRLHGSVPNLSRYLEPSQGQLPFSLPPEYSQLQRSFWVLAQKVHDSLSSVVTALTAERARLEDMQRALDRRRSAPRPGSAGPTGTPLPGLEPRDGLQRFHSLSVSSDATMDSFASLLPDEVMWGRGWGWRAMERVLSPAVPAARRAACQGPGAAALAAQHRLAGRLTH